MKRFLYYFVWTVVIGLIFYLAMKWRVHIVGLASLNFEFFPVVLFSTIFPIVMGLLLRLPQLIIEVKENRKWTFDWAKFTAIGLPTLLILVVYGISYLGIMPVIDFILISEPILTTVAGIIFGYILLDSLKK